MELEQDEAAGFPLHYCEPPALLFQGGGHEPRSAALATGMRAPGAAHDQALVCLIDCDAHLRGALMQLEEHADWQLELFGSAEEFLERPRHGRPNCVVLDVNLQPGGLELQSLLASERADSPVIFTTAHFDLHLVVQAMKAGAVDFLTKPVNLQSLLEALKTSLARSRAILERSREWESIHMRYMQLTSREQQVMALVVSGLLNKQVGAELGISEITVKAHRGSAMRKMRARSLPELVKMSLKLNVLVPESVN